MPFFDEYPLQGVKKLDCIDFFSVVKMMNEGKHLTQEGFEEIRAIKSQMNRGRGLDK